MKRLQRASRAHESCSPLSSCPGPAHGGGVILPAIFGLTSDSSARRGHSRLAAFQNPYSAMILGDDRDAFGDGHIFADEVPCWAGRACRPRSLAMPTTSATTPRTSDRHGRGLPTGKAGQTSTPRPAGWSPASGRCCRARGRLPLLFMSGGIKKFGMRSAPLGPATHRSGSVTGVFSGALFPSSQGEVHRGR